MQKLRAFIGILLILMALQTAALMTLGLIVYQATPHSVLANQTLVGRMTGVLSTVRFLDRAMNVLYRGPKPPEALPSYRLQVASKDLEKIEKALPTDLPSPWYGNLFLTDDNKEWVDGTFTAEGEDYAVRVRVRGDLFNHWAYRKKSWRVRFTDDHLFNEMSEINLIIPEDRGWTAEPLNAYRAKKLGLLQPSMRYVTLSLNDGDEMVYTEIEQFGKEMLARLGRPGDVNLFQTGGGTSWFQQWDAVFESAAYWDKFVSADESDSYEEIDLLLQLSKPGAHAEPGYREKLAAVFDLDQLVHWYAQSLLSGSRHVRDHNLRLLFDRGTKKFEPIPWDVSLYAPRSLLGLPGNPFLNEVFRVPELRLAVHRFLWEYINDDEQVAEDVAEAARLRALLERAAYRDSVKLPSNRQVEAQLNSYQRLVQTNFDFLKEELQLSEILVEQRIPTTAEQQRGHLMTLDFIARGTVAARLAELSLPPDAGRAIADGSLQLLRDDGDGTPDASDTVIPVQLQDGFDEDGNKVVSLGDEALLWPGDPEIGEGEEVLNAPHTRHRFFLVRRSGDLTLKDDTFPASMRILNAVTGGTADVLGEVLINERTLEGI